MTNENINRLNGGRGRTSQSSKISPREATRRVSFSSEISVLTDCENDASESTTTKEALSGAAAEDDLSPRSLLSGRWIEDTKESNETRGVAVVEVTDHSPGSKCAVRKHMDDAKPNRSSPNCTRFFDRNESPIRSRNVIHSITALTESDATMSSLNSNRMDADEHISDLPTSISPRNASDSPFSQTHDEVFDKLLEPGYERLQQYSSS